MLVCILFVQSARETAGAARTRSSLRPLMMRARNFWQSSGVSRRENAKVYPRHCERGCIGVIASAARQSTLPYKERLDCFATLAMTWIGRGMLGPPLSRRTTGEIAERVTSQQYRLFRHNGISDRDAAAG